MWLGGVLALRTIATTDMTYWQISRPLLLMGLGLPFFFVPLTTTRAGQRRWNTKPPRAAGLMNFLRTLSGAVATSVVTTGWENKTQVMHAELAGVVDRSGEVAHTLAAGGMNADQTRQALDNLTQSQSVMLATNEIMCVRVAGVLPRGAADLALAPRLNAPSGTRCRALSPDVYRCVGATHPASRARHSGSIPCASERRRGYPRRASSGVQFPQPPPASTSGGYDASRF